MSFIGKNIKKIRTVKKINQADFADLFGLARASVGSYEEGRAEPKVDTIIAIANHFGISIDLLLKKELTVNELYRFDIFRPELLTGEVAPKATLPQPETFAITTPGIPLISAAEVGEYVVQKGANTFTAQQPQLQLPFLPKGNYRAFEVYENATPGSFQQGDVVLGRKLSGKEKPKDGQYYMILTPTLLTLRQWPDANTIPGNVTEYWEITHYIGTPTANRQTDSLEQRVAKLERLVNGLMAKK